MTRANTYTKPNHRRPALPISAKQRTVIMIICTQFGISKTERAELLQERYGKSSTGDLTSDQAGHFIAEFEKKGFKLQPKKGTAKALPPRGTVRKPIARTGGNVIALVTQDERDKIAKLADLIEWRVENGLALFLEKRMGIREGKVRTGADAYAAIEGLKKMFENGMKAKHGKDWWHTLRLNPGTSEGVLEYIELHCPEEWR
ncbi:MAG: phage protein GemA/Gp16 family protein [Desulfuromonadaceae bacterium]